MTAERDTNDRYLAAYLSDRVGSEFTGRISGVQRFGLFVKLDETGADGLIPIREVGREFFHYDDQSQTLMGADTGLTIGIGQRVTVRLAEAVPVTGGLMLELLEIEGGSLPPGRSGKKKGRFSPRKPSQRAARDAQGDILAAQRLQSGRNRLGPGRLPRLQGQCAKAQPRALQHAPPGKVGTGHVRQISRRRMGHAPALPRAAPRRNRAGP